MLRAPSGAYRVRISIENYIFVRQNELHFIKFQFSPASAASSQLSRLISCSSPSPSPESLIWRSSESERARRMLRKCLDRYKCYFDSLSLITMKQKMTSLRVSDCSLGARISLIFLLRSLVLLPPRLSLFEHFKDETLIRLNATDNNRQSHFGDIFVPPTPRSRFRSICERISLPNRKIAV